MDETLRKVYSSAGVLVADAVPHGPADDAGVRPGDFITALGDAAVTSIDEVRQLIAQLEPEAPVRLQLLRDRRPLEVEVVATSALGLRVRQIARSASASAPQALTLFSADEQAAADLLPRSRILMINGQAVTSADAARTQLRRARAPVVLYVEDERGRFFRVLERGR